MSHCLSRSGCAPLMVTIQAARFSDLYDGADLGALHRARHRAIHGKPAVTAPAVVVPEVVAEEPPQMPLVEADYGVQASRRMEPITCSANGFW